MRYDLTITFVDGEVYQDKSDTLSYLFKVIDEIDDEKDRFIVTVGIVDNYAM